ncbi:hypothetical protein PspLS_00695 [Pyricularia sp. CBS 133598]|nr:hypothetical protein PspLS_00695 [Pyricularia sp. CBS 133598]
MHVEILPGGLEMVYRGIQGGEYGKALQSRNRTVLISPVELTSLERRCKMSVVSGYDRDFWAIVNDEFPKTDEAVQIIDTSSLNKTLGEIHDWADLALGVASEHHENAKNIVQRSLGAVDKGKCEYCCYGMIHEAGIKLMGGMEQLLCRLDLSQSVIELGLIQTIPGNPLLEFADGIPLAQISKPIGQTLEAISKKLEQKDPIDIRAFVRPMAVRDVLQRATRRFDATLKVDMNVYGAPANADVVGHILSECRIFLQDPDHGIVGVDYHNPPLIEFPGFEESTANLAAAERLTKDQNATGKSETDPIKAVDG